MDWTWDTQAVMAQLNASSHSKWERASYDYYATPPKATEFLLQLEKFSDVIVEPACWEWHISKVLEKHWKQVLSSDIVDRWYKDSRDKTSCVRDFINSEEVWLHSSPWDIITNPPYSLANEFLEMAMYHTRPWQKIAFFLRIQFLEWVKRAKIFKKYPPKTIWVSSRTLRCAKNWDFENATGNASTYCWFVWENWRTGDPVVKWFNY